MPKKARSKKTQKKTQKKRITFKLEASEAKEAILAGDFNSWDLKKHTMKKDTKGRWTKIVTLAPGRYEYKFLVDGQWQNDPNNDQMVANSFGTLNNILTV
jgi:1,4-alpha-glucan branching enzyme